MSNISDFALGSIGYIKYRGEIREAEIKGILFNKFNSPYLLLNIGDREILHDDAYYQTLENAITGLDYKMVASIDHRAAAEFLTGISKRFEITEFDRKYTPHYYKWNKQKLYANRKDDFSGVLYMDDGIHIASGSPMTGFSFRHESDPYFTDCYKTAQEAKLNADVRIVFLDGTSTTTQVVDAAKEEEKRIATIKERAIKMLQDVVPEDDIKELKNILKLD